MSCLLIGRGKVNYNICTFYSDTLAELNRIPTIDLAPYSRAYVSETQKNYLYSKNLF